ncbi:NSFL1 cofactor p47-like isoform X2 [Ctenocephalides felis]|uniref:NSFL1 cofactor p47-like isoform X2 n=1 Tax=Ctenocephalides felis TaxID=7515 RepID=UPI000E6E2754|nr:NSFL1 cofactor p47-like isoform X2 [Ctenocephalides felis]
MENEEKINQFEAITGVSKERAKFHLESAAWQLEVALASFYEHGGDDEDGNVEDDTNSPPQSESAEVTQPPQSRQTSKPNSRNNSRFATVQSLQQSQVSSDEEEGQAFYAGGSRNSGQQILGPPKKRDIVADMFKAVQEHASEVLDPQHSTSSSTPRTFQGVGYRLGQTPEDSTAVSTPKTENNEPTTVVLKLWRDGFTLGDGPMRMYSDPENGEFLDHIKKGEIPPELIQEAHGAEVHLDLEDHRHEQYIPPKTKVAAFSGKGHTLGSPAPNVVSAPKLPTNSPTAEKDNEQAAVTGLATDESSPSTNIQVRLSDGSRLSGRFNHSHTIGDLRRYITTARPQYENTNFSLLTTFPSRELSNLEETVAQAGLLNAAVMQRLK